MRYDKPVYEWEGKLFYTRIDGRMLCTESQVPMKYISEFLRGSSPSLVKHRTRYHSLARTRKFLKSKGLEFEVKQVDY